MHKKIEFCNFCEKENPSLSENEGGGKRYFWVTCDNCGAEGPAKETEEEAINAWNYGRNGIKSVLDFLESALKGADKIDLDIGMCIGWLSKKYGNDQVRVELRSTVDSDDFWRTIDYLDAVLKPEGEA